MGRKFSSPAAFRLVDLEALQVEDFGERHAPDVVVIDDENPGPHPHSLEAGGSRTRIVVPTPGSLSASIVPP